MSHLRVVNSPALPAKPGDLPPIPGSLERALTAGESESSIYTEDGAFVGVRRSWTPPTDVTDSERAAARQHLTELAGIMAPAERGRLLGRIYTLLQHFPNTQPVPPEVEQMLAEDWAEDLAEFPQWAVDEAARRWRRTQKWRPRICEIRQLCDEITAPQRERQTRLQKLLQIDQQTRRGGRQGFSTAADAAANVIAAMG